jgi:hypothetical protein
VKHTHTHTPCTTTGFTLGVDRDVFSIDDWEAYSGDNRIGAVGWGGGAQTNFNVRCVPVCLEWIG